MKICLPCGGYEMARGLFSATAQLCFRGSINFLPQNENLSAKWLEALGPDWKRGRTPWAT